MTRPTVIPRILVDDPEALVAFARDVFGATGEYAAGRPTELELGTSLVMVSGTDERSGASAFLYVYVPDADDAYRRALAAGAQSIEPPSDQAYGDRRAMIRDRWGNTWQIATPT